METTYDVRVGKIRKYVGKRTTTHRVRWYIAGEEFGETYSTYALADARRSELVTATRNGTPFFTATGLPVTENRAVDMPCMDIARRYVDARWPDSAPGSRRNLVNDVTVIVVALLPKREGQPDATTIRKAVREHLNPNTRKTDDKNDGVLRWVEKHAGKISRLQATDECRSLIQALGRKQDGTEAAADTIRLRRLTLSGLCEYAVEIDALRANPTRQIRSKKTATTVRQVDRRCVVNPMQGGMLLAALRDFEAGRRLVAFFGLLYFAALRPEEATDIRLSNLVLPREGMGELLLDGAAPETANAWADKGNGGKRQPLKHRAADTTRPVPCPPELTALLHEHVDTFGVAADGRLFRGARGAQRIPSSVYGRAWERARAAVFTTEVCAGPLAKRPYDLRHACVSTWLNRGVEPTRVAEWAGHSVAVLLRVYAKCLDGGESQARARLEHAFRPF